MDTNDESTSSKAIFNPTGKEMNQEPLVYAVEGIP